MRTQKCKHNISHGAMGANKLKIQYEFITYVIFTQETPRGIIKMSTDMVSKVKHSEILLPGYINKL